MSFFKRKDQNLIPPVQPAGSTGRVSPNPNGNSTSPRPGVRSTANTYVASRDGDPYNTSRYNTAPPQQQDPYASAPDTRDRYGRNNGVGDVYSRARNAGGEADVDQDRNELFSGYNAQKAGSGRFFDGPQPGREPPPGEENEEDVEGIKQQTKWVKQESVNSTRNALRLAREAEETARGTLTKLGDQSERLANTERHLDISKGHSSRANDHATELKQLNRSIFRPVITFNKDSKRAAADAKVQSRYEAEREEREKAMMDIRDTQNRIGRAATYGRGDDQAAEEELYGGRRVRGQPNAQQLEQRKRYQFEKSASDDEMENELDDNMDEIGEATKRLKALGMAMGDELDNQNKRLDRLEKKTVDVDNRLHSTTGRLTKYGGK